MRKKLKSARLRMELLKRDKLKNREEILKIFKLKTEFLLRLLKIPKSKKVIFIFKRGA